MSTLNGKSVASTYDQIVKRQDTYSATGNQIEIMDDSGVIKTTELYLDATNSRVGIGTDSPVNTLSIKGSVNQLDIETSTAGVTLESVDRSDLNAQSDLSYYARHGEHKFFGGSYTERLRIESGGHTRPGADDSYDLGTASYRWDDVYATNGTIQTSDERMKDNVSPSSLGLNFVNQLNPVEYKWKDYDYEEQSSPAIEAKDEIAWGDELPTDENTKDEIKAFMDGYGFEYNSGDTKSDLLDKIPSVKQEAVEAQEAVFETKTKTFSRKHYGLIAQEVEQVLVDSGIEREDFAPLIYDEDSDRYGMRYGEMVGILIKSVQELSAKVEALENK